MSQPVLTGAFGAYDRIFPLLTQEVSIQGLSLQLQIESPSTIFRRMTVEGAYDVSEMSMAAYLHYCGASTSPLVGMPAFPSRAFRHSMLYINDDAGITAPCDLNGKTIVIREWGMTALVWFIGLLSDEYGFDPGSVKWLVQRPPRAAITPPAQIDYSYLESEQSVSEVLEAGVAQAAMVLEVPQCFGDGTGRVRRLFEDYPAAERQFYQREKIHPIMHTVVMSRDCFERYPWALKAVYGAMEEAKSIAAKHLRDLGTLSAMVPFLAHGIADTIQTFGDDWWPYGVDDNRQGLSRLCRFAFEQGLTPRELAVDEVFAEFAAAPVGQD